MLNDTYIIEDISIKLHRGVTKFMYLMIHNDNGILTFLTCKCSTITRRSVMYLRYFEA